LIGDASEAGVRKVLGRLAAQGIVEELRIGSQYSYVANRQHLLWPAVETVMHASESLEERMRQLVGSWPVRAISVELFGSVATGDPTAESDVDVIVYRPHLDQKDRDQWDTQLTELRGAVERWTGNSCEILEIDTPTLVEMAAADEPILHSPRLHISGEDLRTATPAAAVAREIRDELFHRRGADIPQVRLKRLVDRLIPASASPALQALGEDVARYWGDRAGVPRSGSQS
jgi:predicted nucleotidyltransferase